MLLLSNFQLVRMKTWYRVQFLFRKIMIHLHFDLGFIVFGLFLIESAENSSAFFEVVDWLLFDIRLKFSYLLACVKDKLVFSFGLELSVRGSYAWLKFFFFNFWQRGLKVFFDGEESGCLGYIGSFGRLIFLKLLLILLLYLQNMIRRERVCILDFLFNFFILFCFLNSNFHLFCLFLYLLHSFSCFFSGNFCIFYFFNQLRKPLLSKFQCFFNFANFVVYYF